MAIASTEFVNQSRNSVGFPNLRNPLSHSFEDRGNYQQLENQDNSVCDTYVDNPRPRISSFGDPTDPQFDTIMAEPSIPSQLQHHGSFPIHDQNSFLGTECDENISKLISFGNLKYHDGASSNSRRNGRGGATRTHESSHSPTGKTATYGT
jgi:hypothetical protein